MSSFRSEAAPAVGDIGEEEGDTESPEGFVVLPEGIVGEVKVVVVVGGAGKIMEEGGEI